MFCQTSGQMPAGPSETGKKSPDVFTPQSEISKGPTTWHFTLDGLLTVPPGIGRLRMPDAPADPKMIVHPPQGSIGAQPRGTQVAQNLYPGLQFMPIEKSTSKMVPIPTTFPNMKMEKITTTWSQYKALPVQSGKVDTTPK